MFSLAPTLEASALRARDRSTEIARAAATAMTQPGGGGADRAMAASAEQAMFSEALLAALKARLGELKAVSK